MNKRVFQLSLWRNGERVEYQLLEDLQEVRERTTLGACLYFISHRQIKEPRDQDFEVRCEAYDYDGFYFGVQVCFESATQEAVSRLFFSSAEDLNSERAQALRDDLTARLTKTIH